MESATDTKRQLNVYLDRQLIHAVKQGALDADQTLSDYVAEALSFYLQRGRAVGPILGEVTPVPILFVQNMRAWLKLCRALGLRLRARSRNGRWAEMESASGLLGLHLADSEPDQSLEMAFQTEVALEELQERLTEAGFTTTEITDEGWGRSMSVHGSGVDGIAINEHDPAMYA